MPTVSVRISRSARDAIDARRRPGQSFGGALDEVLAMLSAAPVPDPPGSRRDNGVLVVPLPLVTP